MQQQKSTMQLSFLSSISRDELKEFIGGIVGEALTVIPERKPQAAVSYSPGEEPPSSVAEAPRITGLSVNTLYDKAYQPAIPQKLVAHFSLKEQQKGLESLTNQSWSPLETPPPQKYSLPTCIFLPAFHSFFEKHPE